MSAEHITQFDPTFHSKFVEYNAACQNHIGEQQNVETSAAMHAEWLHKQFPLYDAHGRIIEFNRQFHEAEKLCTFFASRYLNTRKKGKPDTEEYTYDAHSKRSTHILVDELKIRNPYVYATTRLHDIGEAITKQYGSFDGNDPFFEELATELESCNLNLPHLANTLLSFYRQDQEYDRLANNVLADAEIQTMARNNFESRVGFTPRSYYEMRRTIIKKFMFQEGPDQYKDLESLIKSMSYDMDPSDNPSGVSEGMAITMAMFAQAIDNHRVLVKELMQTGNPHLLTSERMEQLHGAIDVICSQLPAARILNHGPAIRELSDIPGRLFADQYAACEDALKLMMYQTDSNSERSMFDVMARASMIQIIKQIEVYRAELHEQGIETSMISAEEFEMRKILAVSGKWPENRPLLDSHEIAIIGPSIKSMGSIIPKWLKHMDQDQLAHFAHHIADNPTHEDVTEAFKDPHVWVEYLNSMPDLIRATVVLGDELAAQYFGSDNNPDPIIDRVTFQHIHDGDKSGCFVNCYKPYHPETAAKDKVKERKALQQIEHLILQQKSKTSRGRSVPFELHIYSIEEWIRNNLGAKLHLFYKAGEMFDPTVEYTSREKELLTFYYRKALASMHKAIYNGSLPV